MRRKVLRRRCFLQVAHTGSTVFGSVLTETWGLFFYFFYDKEMMEKKRKKVINIVWITLFVYVNYFLYSRIRIFRC